MTEDVLLLVDVDGTHFMFYVREVRVVGSVNVLMYCYCFVFTLNNFM